MRADDYSMPHTWINLSFYSSNKKVLYNSFTPRIKVPNDVLASVSKGKVDIPSLNIKAPYEENALPNLVQDYDNYDAQVFKLPNSQNR